MNKKYCNDYTRPRFTLDQPICYRIIIAGPPWKNWSEWVDQVEVKSETDSSGTALTTLIGTFDQAGLHGLLRRLYYLGYPLVSVNYIPSKEKEKK